MRGAGNPSTPVAVPLPGGSGTFAQGHTVESEIG